MGKQKRKRSKTAVKERSKTRRLAKNRGNYCVTYQCSGGYIGGGGVLGCFFLPKRSKIGNFEMEPPFL